MKQFASIFNDVLGPVMSGPSSSHTAASVRIGNILGQMISGKPASLKAEFDEKGSLASCWHSQWVDMGLAAGILGMFPDDEKLSMALDIAEEKGIDLEFITCTFPNNHPNTYKLTLKDDIGNSVNMIALSVGGGMVEVINVNGYKVSINGGFYETLIFADCPDEYKAELFERKLLKHIPSPSLISYSFKGSNAGVLFVIKSEQPVPDEIIRTIDKSIHIRKIYTIAPVLPVTSQIKPSVPFKNAADMLELAELTGKEMWEMGVMYESIRGGLTENEVLDKMNRLVQVMKKSLETGLAGTEYEKRLLGCQSKYFEDSGRISRIIPDDKTNEIIRCISALMEVKSSMGIFVAAPTAGSCGCVPGTILAIAGRLDLSDDHIVKAMLAAGLIGVFLAEKATFAAEVAGCQAECGSGSGMAASGLVQLMNGTPEECCGAASMALQNVFGMTCDPVGMAVEVPCLGKNIMAGVNAFTSANMSLLGFDHVIPLDETIISFNEVGRLLPPELRCTGMAGLTKLPSARKAAEKLV